MKIAIGILFKLHNTCQRGKLKGLFGRPLAMRHNNVGGRGGGFKVSGLGVRG